MLNAFSLNVIFKAIAHLFFKDYQKITIAKIALALMRSLVVIRFRSRIKKFDKSSKVVKTDTKVTLHIFV